MKQYVNWHLAHLIANITFHEGIRSYTMERRESSIASNGNSVAASAANASATVE